MIKVGKHYLVWIGREQNDQSILHEIKVEKESDKCFCLYDFTSKSSWWILKSEVDIFEKKIEEELKYREEKLKRILKK